MKKRVASLLAIAASIVLIAAPAFAATAVIYKGTLGSTAIVVELSADVETATGAVTGRYAYMSKGIDIPLDVQHAAPGEVELVEEKPCTVDLCKDVPNDAPEGTLPTPPLGAKWHLEAAAGGKVSGTWQDGGKTLPIALERVGSRRLDENFTPIPSSLSAVLINFYADEENLTAKTSPYDYLKMQVPYKASTPTQWGEVAFDYLTDPRTKFPFPHVISLGGADMTPVNDYLDSAHWENSAGALDCMASVYQGLGWYEGLSDDAGTLGGFEDEQLEVTYLSPTVMSYTQGGSIFCGGAHPDNHFIQTTLDVRAGKPLDMSRIFKGWVPTPFADGGSTDLDYARAHPDDYEWGPDQQLADFVRAHRNKDGDEEDCGYDDLVESNLKISFLNGDKVSFGLDGLANVIFACTEELYQAPIASLGDLLTPEAADYFPSLKGK
ncbi:MAG TPA: hypothetical protein VGM83_19570 [Devosiaceae bacterium]|jgi:hypothetical protein